MSRFSPKPRTASQAFVLDGGLLGKIDQLKRTVGLAERAERISPGGLDSPLPKLQRELDELIQRASEEAVVFTVKALPGAEFDDIKREHGPNAEQLERYREQVKGSPWVDMPEFDPASMGPDLLVACLTEPEMTEAEIRELWSALSKGEQNQLWNLALGVQVEGANLPLSKAAIGMTDDGGEQSITSASEESR